MTNDKQRAVETKVPLTLTLEINQLFLQVGGKLLWEGKPAVSIRTGSQTVHLPLSVLTAAVDELNRFWSQDYPLVKPKETITSEETNEEN